MALQVEPRCKAALYPPFPGFSCNSRKGLQALQVGRDLAGVLDVFCNILR